MMRSRLREIRVVYVGFRRRTSGALGTIQLLLGVVGIVGVVIGVLQGMKVYLIFSTVALSAVSGACSILSSRTPSKSNVIVCLIISLLCCLCTLPTVAYVLFRGMLQSKPAVAEALGCGYVNHGHCLIRLPQRVVVDHNGTCVWHGNHTCTPSEVAPLGTACSVDDLKLSCGFDDSFFFANRYTVIVTYLLIGTACVEFITSLVSALLCCRSLCCQSPLASIVTKRGRYTPIPQRLLSVLSSSGEEETTIKQAATTCSLKSDSEALEVAKDLVNQT